MPNIYMIRHGRAAASYSDDLDPGLDSLGRQQAIDAGLELQSFLPLQLLSSPLKRALETASPLARTSGITVNIETRVSEVPSPGLSLSERGPWLRGVMQGKWHDQSDALQQWQRDMVTCLLALTEDTAIFSHYVAINAMVAAAEQSELVMVFRPDNGSITEFNSDGTTLGLVARGREAVTTVN